MVFFLRDKIYEAKIKRLENEIVDLEDKIESLRAGNNRLSDSLRNCRIEKKEELRDWEEGLLQREAEWKVKEDNLRWLEQANGEKMRIIESLCRCKHD